MSNKENKLEKIDTNPFRQIGGHTNFDQHYE